MVGVGLGERIGKDFLVSCLEAAVDGVNDDCWLK